MYTLFICQNESNASKLLTLYVSVMEDDRHPTCARCDRGGFLCRGYADPVLFVDETPRVQRAARGCNRKRAEEGRLECYEEGSNLMAAIENPSLSQQRGTFSTVHEHSDTLRHYVSPDLSGFEEEIHLSFLCSKLFFGAPARGQNTLVEKSWIYGFPLQCTSNAQHESEQIPMSLTCALATQALAKAFFGRMHGQQSIIVKGADLYGNALRSLRGDLQNFNSYESFSLLTSLMTVFVYEVGSNLPSLPNPLYICAISY